MSFKYDFHKLTMGIKSTFSNCFLSDQISGLSVLHYEIHVFFLTFAVSNCGKHWHTYRSGCFRLFEDHKNRVDANQHCATFNTPGKGNGRLISIFSQDDNNQIVNLRSSKDFSQGMKSHNSLRVYIFIILS